MPRRHMLRYDDYDFQPIPRLLPCCLHTICHSCLEDQFQRSLQNESAHSDGKETVNVGRIRCPVCNKEDIIKSVKYLPFDISTLKLVCEYNSTQLMSYCARCYNAVSSVSWCESCSSALCEFHHQDHKLSINTSSHNIRTFKEISYINQSMQNNNPLHIEFKFPPVPCSEAVMSDSSIYCHTCMRLISAQAMVDNHHQDHKLENYTECIDVMTSTVQGAVKQMRHKGSDLKSHIKKIQKGLQTLADNEATALRNISQEVGLILSELKEREKDLTKRVHLAVQSRRQELQSQLETLAVLLEDCEHSAQVAEELLRNTIPHNHNQNNNNSSNSNGYESMYLVAAADAIEFRVDDLAEEVDSAVRALTEVDTLVRAVLAEEAVMDIRLSIRCLGSVECPAEMKQQQQSQKQEETVRGPSAAINVPSSVGAGTICFTLAVSDSSDAKVQRPQRQHSAVCIEVRERRYTDSQKPSALNKGVLLGTVELITEMDMKSLRSLEMRSYFESVGGGNGSNSLPKITVTKEFVGKVCNFLYL